MVPLTLLVVPLAWLWPLVVPLSQLYLYQAGGPALTLLMLTLTELWLLVVPLSQLYLLVVLTRL